MDIPQDQDIHFELLQTLVSMLTDRETTTHKDEELCYVEIKFEGSPEGLTVGFENAKKLGVPLKNDNTFHAVIIPWPYNNMVKEEKKEMKELTQHFLEIFPNASLQMKDDGSWDWNPNSNLKISERYYMGKERDPEKWKEYFLTEDDYNNINRYHANDGLYSG